MLRAAARLFSDHGFHETSLDKLSDAIGAKKPTLYHYLGNKEQMVFECLKIGIEDVHQAAAHAKCGPGTRADRKSAVSGTRESERGDTGGGPIVKKKKTR